MYSTVRALPIFDYLWKEENVNKNAYKLINILVYLNQFDFIKERKPNKPVD